jgi:hypothetical protein
LHKDRFFCSPIGEKVMKFSPNKTLTALLSQLLCRLNGKHVMGAKFRSEAVRIGKIFRMSGWYQSCVICDHTEACEAPKPRGKK